MAKLDIIMQGSSFRTNLATIGICTIALIRERGNVLVDTGHFGTRRQVLKGLELLGLAPRDIERVILTHSHWDHALNLELFRNATVLINAKELAHVNAVTGDDWATSSVLKLIMEKMKLQTTKGDEQVSNDVTVVETPGHSPGHQSVLVTTQTGKVLLSGDAMPTLRSYFRGLPDFITTTEEEARRSIDKLKMLRPDVYYPGHDRPFRIVKGEAEYVGQSELKVIFRRETEENFSVVLSTEMSEKPEKVKS
jgi:N-acyl homoserine lactone hydrolase